MNILQTIGIFVGFPALFYVVLWVLTVGRHRAKRGPRYRPDQPWEYTPVLWAGDQPVVVPQSGALTRSNRGGARGKW